MKIDKKKLEVVSLIDEEGYSYKQLMEIYNTSYASIHNWYDSMRYFYYKMEEEKDNKDHIIHLDITPKLYYILSRVNIYSINEVISKIEDNTIMQVRGMGKIILSDLLYAVSSYKYKTAVEVLYSTVYRNKRILKLKINTLGISTLGIFEYNINSKDEKLYLEIQDENMSKVKDRILKEVEEVIYNNPTLGILNNQLVGWTSDTE